MDMNSKLDTVLHQQQMIMQEMSKTRVKNTPQHIADCRVLLPLQTVDQLQALDRQLQASSADKQALVCTCTVYVSHLPLSTRSSFCINLFLPLLYFCKQICHKNVI